MEEHRYKVTVVIQGTIDAKNQEVATETMLDLLDQGLLSDFEVLAEGIERDD